MLRMDERCSKEAAKSERSESDEADQLYHILGVLDPLN
jgi:hypothetical protein